jgi:hypothetical protein
MPATQHPHLRLVASDGELVNPNAGATLAEALLDYAGARPGLRVIEFTYGPARLAWRFRAVGCHVVSVDLAAAQAYDLPEEWSGAFDVAVTSCALHQSPDCGRLLAAVACCVRAGGVCAGLEPSHDDFSAPDVRARAAEAGLSLFQTEQHPPTSALFWRAQVPAILTAPPPPVALAA